MTTSWTTSWTTPPLTSVTSATATTATTITTTSTPLSLLESLVNLNDLLLLTLLFPLCFCLLSSNEDVLLLILLERSSVLPFGVISGSFVGLTSGWEGSKGGSLSGLLSKVVIIGLDLLLWLLCNLRSGCSLSPRLSTPILSTPRVRSGGPRVNSRGGYGGILILGLSVSNVLTGLLVVPFSIVRAPTLVDLLLRVAK